MTTTDPIATLSRIEHAASHARTFDQLRRAESTRIAGIARARRETEHATSREHLASTAAKLARWLDTEAARRAIAQ